jgi:diamine N-acetyltransferase
MSEVPTTFRSTSGSCSSTSATRGYGTATLDLIVEYFRRRPEVEVMKTSACQGKGSPIGFYERYGFERTGDIVFDNEVLLQFKLR